MLLLAVRHLRASGHLVRLGTRFAVLEVDLPPEYDGHTPADAAGRGSAQRLTSWCSQHLIARYLLGGMRA